MEWLETIALTLAPFASGIFGVWTGKKLTEFRLDRLEKGVSQAHRRIDAILLSRRN